MRCLLTLLVLMLPAARSAACTGPAGCDAAGVAGRWLIAAYQAVLSPLQPRNTCNFHPSCSRFTGQAIASRGIIAGSVIGADRLLRCQPFAWTEFGRAYTGTTGDQLDDPVPGSAAPDPEPGSGANRWSPGHPVTRSPSIPDPCRLDFGFARWLQDQGEVYRAGVEFARLSSLAPDSTCRVLAGLLAGESFLDAERPGLARSAFRSVLPDAPDAGRLGIARAEFYAGRYEDCRRELEQLGPGLDREREVLIGWTLFRERRFPAAAVAFRQLGDPELMPLAALDGSDLSRRRPAVAGVLSALVPGAGQAYAGRFGDAFYALAAVAGSGFITWWYASEPGRDRTRVKTVIFGATTALFHAGNIYGATAAARSYNRWQERRYLARAETLLVRVRMRPRYDTDN